MSEVLAVIGFFLIPSLISLAFLAVLGVISRKIESDQEEDLARREAAVSGFPLSDLRRDPLVEGASTGQLVVGSVVMGTGRRRQFTARIRSIVGGEVKGYQRVLHAARRESQLRMIEDAMNKGATAIINVRFETSDVGNPRSPSSEILCYGTGVLTQP